MLKFVDSIKRRTKETLRALVFSENGENFKKYLEEGIVEIGKYSYTFPEIFYLGERGVKVIIGNYCSIAKGVTIYLGGDHNFRRITTFPLEKYFRNQHVAPLSKGNVTIGNDVWIGRDATILSGVKVGNGAVIGACSFVVSKVPPFAVVSGNPAKILFYRFSQDQINKLERIQWWNWDDKKIIENIESLSSTDINDFLNKFYDDKLDEK